jgi:alpha-L-fucosidase 2
MIASTRPAEEWAEGYPIGNGRIGGMVLGHPLHERIALNHDLLWRRFWTYQDHQTAGRIDEIHRLCLAGQWDEAHEMALDRIPLSSYALYLNPFVPFCDLGIFPDHRDKPISDYRREINLATGCVTITYRCDEVLYKRTAFVSWPAGLMVVHLSASIAGHLSGEICLSRLPDPDCTVRGSSRPGEVLLEGRFEEGVRFSAVVRIVQNGGRLTGEQEMEPGQPDNLPPRDLRGLQFIFRDREEAVAPQGVSTGYDSATEVTLLIALSTSDETAGDPTDFCRSRLARFEAGYDQLLADHCQDHQTFFNRVSLRLRAADAVEAAGASCAADLDVLTEGPVVFEQLFNMGRYLALASGRPQPTDSAAKAPINLQGIWNQDRRPAWDCDYHLDLNLQMCYWSLHLLNLGECLKPLRDWAVKLMPQARHAAGDLYGCKGLLMSAVCDFNENGNIDDLCFWWTGAAAWLAQVLWQDWQYTQDRDDLESVILPFIEGIAQFYEDYLVPDPSGRLVPKTSASPEMGIAGRKRYSTLSSASTMDLELIREVFLHVIEASRLLQINQDREPAWQAILEQLPLPVIHSEGYLQEWLEDHQPGDPGHRHRSHLVGLCPGDRINWEETPEYAAAARQALNLRHSHGLDRSLSLTMAWDAQMMARLYDGAAAYKQLQLILANNIMVNRLTAICDWRDTGDSLRWFGDRRIFQIEAGICLSGAIAEMLMQDRGGLIRLLPALPAAWPQGQINGLIARGGFRVSLAWQQGQLLQASILSERGNICRIKLPDSRLPRIFCNDDIIDVSEIGGICTFRTIPGQTYLLLPTIHQDRPAG